MKLAQTLVDGVAVGAVYSIVALGFVLVYRATGVLNFAHGAIAMVGAYVAHTAFDSWGWWS